MALGGYVCFVDSDDFIHPRYIEILINAIKEDNADIAEYGYIKTDDPAMAFGEIDKPIQNSAVGYPEFMAYSIGFLYVVWAKLYRVDILKNHLFDENLVYGEDAVFNFSLVYSQKNLKIVRVDQSLYYYFNRSDSVVNTLSKVHFLDHIDWFLNHWDVFLDEYHCMIFEYAIKTYKKFRMELYLTPDYDDMMSLLPNLPNNLIKKLKDTSDMPLMHRIKYYSFLKYFQLYRLLLILNDPTIKDYERKKKILN